MNEACDWHGEEGEEEEVLATPLPTLESWTLLAPTRVGLNAGIAYTHIYIYIYVYIYLYIHIYI